MQRKVANNMLEFLDGSTLFGIPLTELVEEALEARGDVPGLKLRDILGPDCSVPSLLEPIYQGRP
jgi:hypothetical protein